MFTKKHRAVLIAVASDTHPNSRVGLAPPVVSLDDGSEYRQNQVQKWLWHNWLDFWQRWIPSLAKKYHADVWYVHNGDGTDDNYHNQHGLITLNKADQIKIAVAIQQPALRAASEVYIVRGTEAHVGRWGELEELVADRLKAHPNPTTGTSSWWFLPLEVEGVKLDFSHHAVTYSRRPWTRGAGVNRQAAIEESNYAPFWSDRPDISVYAHGHYFADSAATHFIRVLYLPPWQVTTSFSRRLGIKRAIQRVGGVAILCDRGEYRLFTRFYEPESGKRFKPRR